MLYNKPKDMSYVDMCIWIDNNAYKDDCDEEKMFQYMYHIMGMLAYKKRYFESSHYYDDYAVFAASQLFMRYRNKKQYGDNPSLTRIKSVLNYAKRICYPLKVQFEMQFYAQNYVEEEIDYDTDFHDTVMELVDGIRVVEFETSVNFADTCLKTFVDKVIAKDDAERSNIYISCLLTLLNSVTLDSKDIKRVEHLRESGRFKENTACRLYADKKKNATILYHLPSNMENFITVLSNEMRHVLTRTLSECAQSDIQSDSILMNAMIRSLDGDSEVVDSIYEN